MTISIIFLRATIQIRIEKVLITMLIRNFQKKLLKISLTILVFIYINFFEIIK